MLILLFIFLPILTQAVVADDVVCTGCINTSDIAINAITSQKIGNGTITNFDISATAVIDPSKISGTAWTVTTDGLGSGLDADLLDGLDSLQFLRADQSGTMVGALTVRTTTTPQFLIDAGSYGVDYSKEAVLWLQSKDDAAQNWRNGLVTDESGNLVLRKSDNANTDPSINALVINRSGDVTIDGVLGVGTISPQAKFSVVAGADAWAGSFFGLSTSDQVRLGTYGGVATLGANNNTGNAWSNLAINPGGGNVGVGTNEPNQKLDVVGNIVSRRGVGLDDYVLLGGEDVNAGIELRSGTYHGSPYIDFSNAAADDFDIRLSLSGDDQLLVNGGNVGIINGALDVDGSVNGDKLCINGDCKTTWPAEGGGGVDLWTQNESDIYYTSGNVGIGTTSPSAGLQVTDNDGALFTGSINNGSIPTTGAGIRMMWYSAKAAFRVGNATATEWDMSNIGYYSVATGYATKASGTSSLAMGDNNTATGDYSAAFGAYSDATGQGSLATGYSTSADGSYSAAFNRNTDVDGNYATAFGYNTTAESYGSVVLGRYNESIGNNSSWVSTDPLFVIGNGTSTSDTHDAFVVDKDGTIEVTGDITSDGEICIGSGC
ncbi:MAG: hypothetical protein HYV33_02550 [Candidatus Kerfeldbacteria bacterium]|nr:hypothetical protein [Candidatus Kerfeldbacteria bacterium]